MRSSPSCLALSLPATVSYLHLSLSCAGRVPRALPPLCPKDQCVSRSCPIGLKGVPIPLSSKHPEHLLLPKPVWSLIYCRARSGGPLCQPLASAVVCLCEAKRAISCPHGFPWKLQDTRVIRPHVASGCLERNPACGAPAASFLLPHELPELLTGSLAVTSGGREPPLIREGEHLPISSIEQIQGGIKGDGEES